VRKGKIKTSEEKGGGKGEKGMYKSSEEKSKREVKLSREGLKEGMVRGGSAGSNLKGPKRSKETRGRQC